MQRYFINDDSITGSRISIVGDDVHHITHVMRYVQGDQFIVCTASKGTYLVEVLTISKQEVLVEMRREEKEKRELPVNVTIAQGIIKGDKFDWVVQKGVECGAFAFIPVQARRSVVKLDEKKSAGRVARWQKIALEGARQSHRQRIPNVLAPIDMQAFLNMAKDYDHLLFAYEAHEATDKFALRTCLDKVNPNDKLLIFVGPEGGIDDSEVAMLKAAGFVAIGLGPRILRAETAPIYVMSAISYALEG